MCSIPCPWRKEKQTVAAGTVSSDWHLMTGGLTARVKCLHSMVLRLFSGQAHNPPDRVHRLISRMDGLVFSTRSFPMTVFDYRSTLMHFTNYLPVTVYRTLRLWKSIRWKAERREKRAHSASRRKQVSINKIYTRMKRCSRHVSIATEPARRIHTQSVGEQ